MAALRTRHSLPSNEETPKLRGFLEWS
jgi:hypothetical protein